MIHVLQQPEPASFDEKVRQKGLRWIRENKIDPDKPLPKGMILKPYWRNCLKLLYDSYKYCAYLAIQLEFVVGNSTVDHFIPKSKRIDLAYEWSNYRLSCTRMNARKSDYEDILDPFSIEDGWFRLEPISGKIYPDPNLNPDIKEAVQHTINRLGLDDKDCRDIRAQYFSECYVEKLYTESFLKKRSPFIWKESKRLGYSQ